MNHLIVRWVVMNAALLLSAACCQDGLAADETAKTLKAEPCGDAKFTAQQVPGRVIIIATGTHPTGGYQVFFQRLPIRIWPPEHRLWHVAPTGPATTAITPFVAIADFAAADTLDTIIVHDANGSHKVKVEQVPDRARAKRSGITDQLAAEGCTIFVKAAKLAGLYDVLELQGPFTVFPPTDEAFKKLPDDVLKWPVPRLRGLVALHIMGDSKTVEEIERAKSIKTWGGQVFVHPGRGLSGDAKNVVPYKKKDLWCDNGIIHVLDGVLIKPDDPK